MVSEYNYENTSEALPLRDETVRDFMEENGISLVSDPRVTEFLRVKGYTVAPSKFKIEETEGEFVCLMHSSMECDCRTDYVPVRPRDLGSPSNTPGGDGDGQGN